MIQQLLLGASTEGAAVSDDRFTDADHERARRAGESAMAKNAGNAEPPGSSTSGGKGCALWVANFAVVGLIGSQLRPRIGDGWTVAVLAAYLVVCLIVAAAVRARRKRRYDS
jgi:hypothetical protein